jgi:predicted DNA binding protein
MWVAKLKLMHKDCHIVPRCKKFHVTTYAFPAGASGGVFKDKQGRTCLTGIHIIQGSDDDRKKFLADLKTDKRLHKFEAKGSKFSYIYILPKGGEHVQLYYNPKLIFVKPVINSSDGFEYWEVASWEKQDLMAFIKDLKKHMDYFELLKMSRTELADVYFPQILPKLSEKQRGAIDYAFKRGYYSYPRKVDLHQLAKELKVSVPTLQEHLRKAEIKLLPFILEQSI